MRRPIAYELAPARAAAGLAAGLLAGLAGPAAGGEGGQAVRLRLPLACEPGETCFVQHLVDGDAGPGARDYACGSLTYDGHNGTDLRLRTRVEAAGPAGAVLAVAAGRVLRGRDDMPDGRAAGWETGPVEGRECGNGLILAHADGWESQYCHLARASLAVRPGEWVAAGQRLGQVGLSGATEFPHLHLTIRRAGRVVDPFAPSAAPGTCDPAAPGRPGETLWEPDAAASLAYRPGAVLNAGFHDGPVSADALEADALRRPGPDAALLVAYVRAIGLRAGDVQHLRLVGPDGAVVAEHTAPALERARAQSLLFVGRRRPAGGWPAGAYTARFDVRRGAGLVLERTWSLAPAETPGRPAPE